MAASSGRGEARAQAAGADSGITGRSLFGARGFRDFNQLCFIQQQCLPAINRCYLGDRRAIGYKNQYSAYLAYFEVVAKPSLRFLLRPIALNWVRLGLITGCAAGNRSARGTSPFAASGCA